MIETGFSLLGKVHREFPVFITGMGLQCSILSILKVRPRKSNFQALGASPLEITFVQDDFLIKLGIKPLMHVVEIRAFSLDSVIVILTQIMNRANKGLNA